MDGSIFLILGEFSSKVEKFTFFSACKSVPKWFKVPPYRRSYSR